jgi:uncharacterized paraquat-inducible protein A
MKSTKILLISALTILSFSVFAQDSVNHKMKTQKTQTKKSIYSCTMHPEVTSDKPGKCSKCGMDLKEKVKTAKIYSCTMHSEVTSDKPGKCSKCNMDLTEKKDDHSRHQH